MSLKNGETIVCSCAWVVGFILQMWHIKYLIVFSRISYKGEGLEKGECGIKISNTNNTHDGNWTCVTRLGHNNFRQNEITAVIQLEVTDEPSSAGSTDWK